IEIFLRPVFMDEIKMAVWDYGSHKAPGPDGYSFMSIKRFWDLLKHDIQEFVIGSSNIYFPSFYADDVIILSEWNQNDMENIIRILNVFYIAFGLKINFHKSNVFGVKVTNNEIVFMAACTGCEAGSFPFSYLGLPLECGHENSKKLMWVKWSNTLASFDKGGLGVGIHNAFNKALLLEWRWRLFNNPNAVWVQVVKAFHGKEAGIDLGGYKTNEGLAKIVRTINHLHSSGIVPLSSIRFKVGDGSSIRFWKDTGPITTGRTKTEFDNLIFDIANMESDELAYSDPCVLSFSNDDSFSVNMVRKHIDERTLLSLSPCTRWYKMIPKKVNIFMWRMFLDKLPNRLNLSSHGLDVYSISCMVCNGSVESNAHTFFTCDTAAAVWRLVRSWTGFSFSSFLSCEDWMSWFDSWHASLVFIPSSRPLVGLFDVLETISHSTLIL
nr:RNA-directed DNA polymerase, eukaryota, reverse transcriptase zinc-binding domain protein [Tanacetum cinerariifolium]